MILGARICKNKACKYPKWVLAFTFQGIKCIFLRYVNVQNPMIIMINERLTLISSLSG